MRMLLDMKSHLVKLLPKTLTSRLTLTVLLSILFVLLFGLMLLLVGDLLHLSATANAAFSDSIFAVSPELVVVFSLFIAVSVSVIVGVYLANFIGSSIKILSTRLREQAEIATEEHRFGPIPDDESLPLEFRDLIDSFNAMVSSLEKNDAQIEKTLQRLSAAKRSLEMTFRHSLEGKILLTENRIDRINPSAIAHLGLSPKNLIGADIHAVMNSINFVAVHDSPLDIKTILQPNGDEGALIIGVTTPGRQQRWLKIEVIPIIDSPERSLVCTYDITEERRIASLRAEIVSAVSHDLLAPLTAIEGYLQLLSQSCKSERSSTIIAGAERSAFVMRDLIGSIVLTARAEEAFAPTEMNPVNLVSLIKEVCLSLEHTSPHQLCFTTNKETATVLGEERRLRQVAVNLIENAQKYSPAGRPIHVSVSCDKGRILMRVEDEGPGIAQEDRDIIFERFIKSPAAAQSPGMGLGLYIARTIIEAHGGSVWAETGDRAGGALFCVSLPAAVHCDADSD